jgi:hypothetical protein
MASLCLEWNGNASLAGLFFSPFTRPIGRVRPRNIIQWNITGDILQRYPLQCQSRSVTETAWERGRCNEERQLPSDTFVSGRHTGQWLPEWRLGGKGVDMRAGVWNWQPIAKLRLCCDQGRGVCGVTQWKTAESTCHIGIVIITTGTSLNSANCGVTEPLSLVFTGIFFMRTMSILQCGGDFMTIFSSIYAHIAWVVYSHTNVQIICGSSTVCITNISASFQPIRWIAFHPWYS